MKLLNRWVILWLLTLPLVTARGQQFMLPLPERLLAEPTGSHLMASFMAEDQAGVLCLPVDKGLLRYDGQQLRLFPPDWQPSDNGFSRLAVAPDGRVWLESEYSDNQRGLSYFEPRLQCLVSLPDTAGLVRNLLSREGVRSLLVDRKGGVWVGLNGLGLVRINPRTLAVDTVFRVKTKVYHLDEDADGMLWLATSSGLYHLDPQTTRFQHYHHQPEQANSLSSDTITAVKVRANGDILLCMVNELNILTPRTGAIRQIGWPLPAPAARMWTNNIVTDEQGNDYFSVGLMVFRLNPQGELQRLEFGRPAEKIISLCITHGSRLGANRLWVNTGQRLYAYDLNRLRRVPSLNLLDVAVNGTRLVEQEQPAQEGFQRDQSGQLSLVVNEGDVVQLRFSATVADRESTFRYQLAGHDRQWSIYTDRLGIATYQPPAGTYSFVLNRAGRTGGWQEPPGRLLLRVVPPFWKTAWFISLAFLGAGGAGLALFRDWSRRRQLRQELARQAFEAATLREMDQLKSRFFANVTHEFRTPLTIILNATEQLADASLTPREHERLGSVRRNAHQLLRLINETLDMAKLDAGKLDRRQHLGDPVAFVEQVVGQFRGMAEQRQIRLEWLTRGPDTRLYVFDDDKLEKIAYNLLSNALKFTLPGGQVRVESRLTPDHRLVLTVADTGIGIPADQLPRIFERFHQVDSSSTRLYSGTGIGLALVKELADWLGGRVGVESQLGKGSLFTVTLPVLPYTSELGKASVIPEVASPEPVLLPPAVPTFLSAEEASQPLVLVIEDNGELRTFIREHLSADYRVETAENGRLGLQQALSSVPDLIISDVMMPEMDGYELTEQLKSDERTSHIPLVLLTAKSSYDSRMKGLGAGADDYLGKPFNLVELSLRIGNCLRTRRHWQRRLATAMVTREPESTLDPRLEIEERFLGRLRQHLHNHLTDESVDTDWLAGQAHMSRSQLHRKLMALTGKSTTRFMHEVRLEKAVELIQQGDLNVAQVAQQVGYNSQSYFTKVFQEHFGYPPTALKR